MGYYPNTDDALVPWWNTFNLECGNYAATFPSILTIGTLAKVAACKTLVLNMVNGKDQAKNYASDIVAYVEVWLRADPGTPVPAPPAVPAIPAVPGSSVVGVEAFARDLVNQLKADPAMTPAIRAAMGIEPPAGALGDPEVQTLEALGGSQVRLRCRKAGYPALQVSSRRAGGAWEVIGVTLTADFTDPRPPVTPGVSEVREYRVQGYLDNVAQGTISAVQSIATTP